MIGTSYGFIEIAFNFNGIEYRILYRNKEIIGVKKKELVVQKRMIETVQRYVRSCVRTGLRSLCFFLCVCILTSIERTKQNIRVEFIVYNSYNNIIKMLKKGQGYV